MSSSPQEETAEAVVQFGRNLLTELSGKFGGDRTLNEVRVMCQIVGCSLKGRTCSVTALHKATGIPIPTVSRAVTNLQNDGWLTDRQDPADGRKRIISLSPRGLKQTSREIREAVQWFKDFRKHGLPG